MRALVVSLALVAASCAAPTPSPTPAAITASAPTSSPTNVPVLTVDTGDGVTLEIHDESGLVIDAANAERGPDERRPQAVVIGDKLTLTWDSGACNNPVLRISGSVDDLRLDFQPDLSPEPEPGFDCPAILLFLGVVLTLSEPVEQDAVRLVVF